MMNLAFKERAAKPRGAHYTVDCYFDHAIRFAPNDGEVKVVYGVYLARTNRKREAVAALEDALKFEHDKSNAYYNLGLVYFDLKNYPEALKAARLPARLAVARATGQAQGGRGMERTAASRGRFRQFA